MCHPVCLQEVYQRLHDELERLEKEESRRPGGSVTGAPSGLGPINTGGGATTFLAGAVAPRHSPHATDEATDWQQDEEVYHRLADEMAKIEQQGGSADPGAPGGPKWIPKARLKHTASEAELLHSPTWEQEQEFEVQQRLHSEMLQLESRADARLRGEVTSGASAADDKAAYDQLQAQLRALEANGVLMPHTDRLGMPRQMSRGSLLPMADSASGVHLRL
jgi:hypothetical protein